jgi:SAM-dependent methyltransferase
MESSYQKEYSFLYNNHWWYRSREYFILNIIETISQKKAKKILDVGCGPGILLSKLKNYHRIEGIEPKESSFNYEDEIDRLIHRFSFPEDSNILPSEQYDIILLLDVLEHIEDETTALLEIRRLLKFGGSLIVTIPAFMSLWGPHDIINHHLRRYNMPDIKALISSCGLTQVWGSYLFGWCFVPVWLIRHIRRLSRRKRPSHDFKIPPLWLNSILQLLSYKEFELTRKYGLPFGTSLIMVVKK